jgi:arylsulfatase
MNHTAFLTLTLTSLLLARPTVLAAEPARSTKPNIIVILADDLGYGDLGCYGAKEIRTPHLDRMAAEGLRFTSFYAQAFCGPSRTALLTGCYPLRVAEVGNKKHHMPVPHARETLLSELLQRAGYATAMIGKWDLAGHEPDRWEHPQNSPLKRGFDRQFGTPASNDFWEKTALFRDDQVIENPVNLTESTTKRYADEAIRFIRERKGQPFFMYLCPNMPHTALHAGAEFRGKSPRGLYGDVVEELDHHVGRILESLRSEGIEQNTVVLFTSDNGPWLLRKENGGSAGPLRGGKTSTWEGGVRVPAIAWAPGRIAPRQTSGRIASTLDLLPTFAKLAEATLPENKIDGRDLSAWLHKEPPSDEDSATHLYHVNTHLQAVRQGRWKLHLPRPVPVPWLSRGLRRAHIAEADLFEIKSPLLYDLDTDISEKTDVAAQHPDVVQQLLALADKARAEIGDYDRIGAEARFFDDGPPRPDMNDWKQEQTKAAPTKNTSTAVDGLQPRLTKPVKLLLDETFATTTLGKPWEPGGRSGAFSIVDGALQGVSVPDEGHGPSVGVPLDGRNVTIGFRFKYAKPGYFLFLLDGESQFGGAAHLLRVSLSSTLLTLAQDRGAPASKLAQKWGKDAPAPTKEQLADPKYYRIEKLASQPAKVGDGQWHRVLIEQHGNDVLVQLDDQPPLAAIGTVLDVKKSRIVFLVGQAGTVLVDDVKVWENSRTEKTISANTEAFPLPSADESLLEKLSLPKAAASLDRTALAWIREHRCGSCHTGWPYLMSRAVLNETPAPALAEIRQFFETRITNWDADEKIDKHEPREVVGTSAALAIHDAQTTGKLQPITRQALDRMWTLQRADGTWNRPKCNWPPFEIDDYYGAVLAAGGMGHAPENYAHGDSAKVGVEKLKTKRGRSSFSEMSCVPLSLLDRAKQRGQPGGRTNPRRSDQRPNRRSLAKEAVMSSNHTK